MNFSFRFSVCKHTPQSLGLSKRCIHTALLEERIDIDITWTRKDYVYPINKLFILLSATYPTHYNLTKPLADFLPWPPVRVSEFVWVFGDYTGNLYQRAVKCKIYAGLEFQCHKIICQLPYSLNVKWQRRLQTGIVIAGYVIQIIQRVVQMLNVRA